MYVFNTHEKPVFSIVTPIYNQESIIVKNIRSIIEFTEGFFEVILYSVWDLLFTC